MAYEVDDKQSAQPLLDAIETLRSAINNLSDGVIIADRGGRFLICNHTARSVLAINPKESLHSWSQIDGWHKCDATTPCSHEELPSTRALAGESVSEMEVFIRNQRCPSGTWILARANPLLDNGGEIQGSIVVFQDISKKKESDSRIQILTNAVEQTADSIIIARKDGAIEYVNPAFESTTGYTRQEALGNTPRILKSGVQDAAFYKKLWATISSGQVFRDTLANRKKSGEIFYAEQTITPMKSAAGEITHYVTVIKDVTELRKLQEQQLQMRLARAVQQQFYRMPPPQIDGFDFAGAAFPADATGGDYFDFVLLQDNSLGIAIGDVSGHGVGSALLMTELRAYLRAYARQSSDISEILTLMNDALVADMEHGRYATLLFCQLYPGSRRLAYASAGHTPGFILNSRGDVKQRLDSLDIPLGFLPAHKYACSDPFILEPGDILALLTDGITEAERPDQEPFGVERALKFIQDHREDSAQDIVTKLFHAVRDFSDGLPQIDDITSVICRVDGSGFHKES